MARHDVPFLQGEQYFAIPSVGGFVEGWSLVCPVEHTYNMRKYYGKPSFARFVHDVVERILSRYGNPVMFEHGSSRSGSLTSCGTDHAHLHIVPLGFSLVDEIVASGKSWISSCASDLAQLPLDKEYLFYSDDVRSNDPAGLVHVLEKPTSQFFRQIIAKTLKRESESDYRQFPLLPLAIRTRQVLAGNGRDSGR